MSVNNNSKSDGRLGLASRFGLLTPDLGLLLKKLMKES